MKFLAAKKGDCVFVSRMTEKTKTFKDDDDDDDDVYDDDDKKEEAAFDEGLSDQHEIAIKMPDAFNHKTLYF